MMGSGNGEMGKASSETGEGAETRDGDGGGAKATHELTDKSCCCV